jgi:hypothetical protein
VDDEGLLEEVEVELAEFEHEVVVGDDSRKLRVSFAENNLFESFVALWENLMTYN